VHGAAFDILSFLMERSPGVVRREELEARLWGDAPPQSDVLRSHIYALRRTIDKPFDRDLLHTVRGYGYQIAAR
jgi:DNA-binding winged helix-turn-helix (wHTH) protein